MIALVVDARDADAIGDEPIWHDGQVVGWVTSGGFGHRSKIACTGLRERRHWPPQRAGSRSRSSANGAAHAARRSRFRSARRARWRWWWWCLRNRGTFVNTTAGVQRKSLAQRLKNDVVLIGEGYVFELERRGYVKSGRYVPEVVVDFPEERPAGGGGDAPTTRRCSRAASRVRAGGFRCHARTHLLCAPRQDEGRQSRA